MDFTVDEIGLVYCPVNGGVYMPQIQRWFIPPKMGYISSMVMSLKDTSFYVAATDKDSAIINHVKLDKNNTGKNITLAKLPKGIYNITRQNNAIVVWGQASKKSKIGIYTNEGVKWILSLSKTITDVEISKKGEIYFSVDSVIANLNTLQPYLKLASHISGFDIDDRDNFIISTNQGVFYQNSSKMVLIATGFQGPLEYRNGSIYVLSNSKNLIWQLTKK